MYTVVHITKVPSTDLPYLLVEEWIWNYADSAEEAVGFHVSIFVSLISFSIIIKDNNIGDTCS